MHIRLSFPDRPQEPGRDMPITQFYDEYGIAEDEQRDIEKTVNNGGEWGGLYSNTHCSLVRIDAPPRETGTNEGVMNNAV